MYIARRKGSHMVEVWLKGPSREGSDFLNLITQEQCESAFGIRLQEGEECGLFCEPIGSVRWLV